MSCPICYENLFDNISQLETPNSGNSDRGSSDNQERPSVLGCGHVFHEMCIAAWLAQSSSGTCPICRKKHSGDPISLYFANDENSKALDDPSIDNRIKSVEVNHRNKIIKTLCANVASAQNETKKLKEKLEDSEMKHKELVVLFNDERTKVDSYKKAANSYRTMISKHKLLTMRMENDIANKSRQNDEQKKRIENLTAELIEQRRVVANMGDVRATNEQLARALKKERTRLDTKNALNMNLGQRVFYLETENSKLRNNKEQQSNSQSVASQFSSITSSSQANNDVPVIDLVSESSHDVDLSEDAEAISEAIVDPWLRYKQPNAQRKLGSTFGVSLKKIESPQSQTSASVGTNMTPSTQSNSNNANPFAIVDKPFASLASKEFTFSIDMPSQKSSLSSLDRSTVTFQKPTKPNVSNGFGGSLRDSFDGRRSANTVQAKINWAPKK
ncbi:hypothetical protein COEREDRAFT_82013 [Coemansia reversa NRRL 1564]|uniref:RING-type domain-containing protein n=1 Tax=Coemansia reversa (strain ATCC 12441 / NRRL 1564) TaxID=763665 RepID=A0A2G5B8X8_COERN|nr:hypothetical protein COEREDRAFT_82013 [Coemansia reversa NRRL 1564]|eukprot:PIA15469.1 hypothetical protein COEREDRAFT_82013 [Coemansia reversa NRRL 1564]